MSGSSSSEPCPNCGASMSTYSDWKPFDMVSGECLNCGFYYETQNGYMSLEELNTRRKDEELEPLDKLPTQKSI